MSTHPLANHLHKATFIFRIMYQSAAALRLKLQSAVAELRRHQLAAIMPRGFDIAMEHICRDPFLDFVDYGRLVATSRFGADKVSYGMAGMLIYDMSDDSSSDSETITAVRMLASMIRA